MLMMPQMVWATASMITASHTNPKDLKEQNMALHWLPFLCVEGGGAPQTPAGGEDCESGDWSRPLEITGRRHIRMMVRCDSGTCDVDLWACTDKLATATAPSATTGTGVALGTPICENLTARDGVPVDGLDPGVQGYDVDVVSKTIYIVCTTCAATGTSVVVDVTGDGSIAK
jgi:hypothetical protein